MDKRFTARGLILCLCILSLLVSNSIAGAVAPRVEMDVAIEPGLNANTSAQRWTGLLSAAGITNVRFRSLQNGDKAGVKLERSGNESVYHVTARLGPRGSLVTSGGQFSYADVARLKKWLAEIPSGGGQPGETKTAFGLTPRQLADVKQALATPLTISTKGMRPEKAIEQIATTIPLKISIMPDVERGLAADDPIRDELQGLSIGTALAAIARPAGCVVVPQPAPGGEELTIVVPSAGGEMWPIGWPPEQKDESKTIPKLFEFLDVDINGAAAETAIDALQGRLKVPVLWDYNNLVRQKVDLKKPVKVPAGKTYYRRILDRVLFQAGLKAEVRVDDAGNPLIWITTL